MRICIVDGCGSETRTPGQALCERHYRRKQRWGDPTALRGPARDSRPAHERWKDSYIIDSQTGCWNWTKRGMPGGYGYISDGAANQYTAHRFVYEQIVGPIPPGMELDHLCRNKKCVNPKHLDPVPRPINALRAARALRENLPETTTDGDVDKTRVRNLMRKRRAVFQADPYRCNYCGATMPNTLLKLCESCRAKKHEQYVRKQARKAGLA